MRARLRIQLRRPGGGPLLTKNVTALGSFRLKSLLQKGKLAQRRPALPRRVRPLAHRPGRQHVTGPAADTDGLRQVAAARASCAAPTRRRSRTASRSIRSRAARDSSGRSSASRASPTLGPITASWYDLNGKFVGTIKKNNRPVISTGIGSVDQRADPVRDLQGRAQGGQEDDQDRPHQSRLACATEGVAPFDGFETWYRIEGELGGGPAPLVALHGGPGAVHDYLLPLADLAREGRAVVFYDQLGNGTLDASARAQGRRRLLDAGALRPRAREPHRAPWPRAPPRARPVLGRIPRAGVCTHAAGGSALARPVQHRGVVPGLPRRMQPPPCGAPGGRPGDAAAARGGGDDRRLRVHGGRDGLLPAPRLPPGAVAGAGRAGVRRHRGRSDRLPHDERPLRVPRVGTIKDWQ